MAIFLFDEWRDSGLSLTAYAGTLGIAKRTLTSLIRNHLPTEHTYDRLKQTFGDSLPPSRTDTERKRELGRLQIRERRPKPGTKKFREMYRKAADKKRGRPRRRETVDRILATRKATGALERTLAALNAEAKSTEGRMRRMLFGRLRHIPRPSRTQIREWARDAASAANRPTADVLAAWMPYLEDRGLWSKVGRKAREDRHAIIAGLESRWPKTSKGNMKHGFWDAIALNVSEAEGVSPPYTRFEMREWYRRHRRYCLASPLKKRQ